MGKVLELIMQGKFVFFAIQVWNVRAREICRVVICSVAAFGAGCCWCVDFSHTIHTTSNKADVPNLAVKSGGRTFFVTPRFQPRFLVGKWFGGTCNVLNLKLMPTTSHDSHNNTQCFHVFRAQARMTLTTSRDKKHIPATNAHQFRPKHAICVVFCCGMGVATPKIHQAARTSKFVAVKGERACKTSDAR